MNPDTGKIKFLSFKEAEMKGYMPVDENKMTQKQRSTMQVSLKDYRSPLGKKLNRSKYEPHVGKKQLAEISKH